MEILPLFDRVLIKIEKKEKTESGFILPENQEAEHVSHGYVVAVGPGRLAEDARFSIKVAVNPGDAVLFNKLAADEVKVDGETLYLVKEEEIKALVK